MKLLSLLFGSTDYSARQLLQLALLYGGLDKSLHKVTGHFTLLLERIMDNAVVECLAACRPRVRALLAGRHRSSGGALWSSMAATSMPRALSPWPIVEGVVPLFPYQCAVPAP